jgi:hypothetical protein
MPAEGAFFEANAARRRHTIARGKPDGNCNRRKTPAAKSPTPPSTIM